MADEMINDLVDFKNQDKKVSELKEKLMYAGGSFLHESYLILKEILKIRQSQMRGYKINTLSRERGIPFSTVQIGNIFLFEHMSDKTKELIKEEKFTHRKYLVVVKRSKELRDATKQDLIIQKYLNGDISLEMIGHTTRAELITMTQKNNTFTVQDSKFIGKTKNYLNLIKNSKQSLSSDDVLKYIREDLEALNKELDSILNKKVAKKCSQEPKEVQNKKDKKYHANNGKKIVRGRPKKTITEDKDDAWNIPDDGEPDNRPNDY